MSFRDIAKATLPQLFTAVGTGIQAAGVYGQSQTAAGLAEAQAASLRQQAEVERAASEVEESDFRRKQQRLLGRQRALFGGAGVELGGTPSMVIADTAQEAELEALKIRHGGVLAGTRLLDQARISALRGAEERRSGLFRTGASLLTGLGRL